MINPRDPDYANHPASPRRPAFGYAPADTAAAPPAVSIITPFYNTGAVFAETARSILRQSLQQWEWLIINDGSTDPDSLQLLARYRSSDPRIRVIDHPANLGLPAARNSGAREAASGYLLYIDSDDLLEPTAAEKWLWYLECHAELAFAGGYSVGFGARQYLWQSGFQDMEANLTQNRVNHLVMVRKQAWEALGGYAEEMRQGLEDWEFWIRAASRGMWGASIPEYLHWYRTRADHSDRWENLKPGYAEELRQSFQTLYPWLYEEGFPHPAPHTDLQLLQMPEELPAQNLLQKNKPRLLLIIPGMTIGGAEKFNLDLTAQMIARGWEVTLASTAESDNAWLPQFERLTPDVFPLVHFLDWKDYPRFLVYLIQSRRPDAVIVLSSHEGYRMLPCLRARFPDLPLLDHLHFVTPAWMDGGFPRLSLLFQPFLDLSVVTSQQVKGWLAANGASPGRVEVCATNIDADFWQPDPRTRQRVRQAHSIPDANPVLLYVGRLEQQKQPAVFAKTLRHLRAQGAPFTAVVIGKGSLQANLQAAVREYGLAEHVIFTGALPQDQVRDWMAAGDILFLPSENEGISLTIYEGMACGLAMVGADVGGQRELVIPECGVLLPRQEEDEEARAYAAALGELIRDPRKRAQMGRAARERILAHFRLDQMGEHMQTLIVRAGQLRRADPRPVDSAALARLLTRQSVEYLSALRFYRQKEADVAQLQENLLKQSEQQHRLQQEVEYAYQQMPPASAGTYFYLALRQAFYPLFNRAARWPWFAKIQAAVKALLVRKPAG